MHFRQAKSNLKDYFNLEMIVSYILYASTEYYIYFRANVYVYNIIKVGLYFIIYRCSVHTKHVYRLFGRGMVEYGGVYCV